MTDVLPLIVLVHGAWTPPTMYQHLMDVLAVAGYEVKSPLLPSCDQTVRDHADFSTDVSLIRNYIVSKCEEGHQIILLMHSYGGAVGTEAVEGLGFTERRTKRLLGGVIGLIYMCAFMLRPGRSVKGMTEKRMSRSAEAHSSEKHEEGDRSGKPSIVFLPEAVKNTFMSDVDSAIVRSKSSSSFAGMQIAVMGGAVTHATWKDVATTFIRTGRDLAITPEMQDGMIEAARSSGAEIATENLNTGHSPFITMPDQVAAIITRARKRFQDSLYKESLS